MLNTHDNFFWTTFNFSKSECPISIAKEKLGADYWHWSENIDKLTPIPEHKAKPNSLSRRIGLGEQPQHTDGAHLTRPPAFILLWCVSGSKNSVPTHLRKFIPELLSHSFIDTFRESIWSVRLNTRQFFYSRPMMKNCSEIKWDSGCYVRCASHALDPTGVDAIFRCLPSVEFHWRDRLALLINNRRTLHGRAAITSSAQTKRELFRVTFYDR